MADSPAESKPGVCDGKDHGVSSDRLAELREEAYAFNQLLRVNEPDKKGAGHVADVQAAAQNFYKFLGKQPDTNYYQSNEGRAFEASKSLYEQLAHLPIGERRALSSLAMQQNQQMAASDQVMPTLKIKLDSHAFIDDMTVKYPWILARDINTGQMGYAKEDFTFHYLGMCAEYPPIDPYRLIPPASPKPWIEIPTFKLFHWGR